MTGDFTVGVEEEYQLVDAGTGALCSRARRVIALDWSRDIRPELQETTLEIGTEVCASAAELERELRRLRFQVAAAAAAEGLEIVAAGTHPFTRWLGQRITEGERYRGIVARYGRIARDEHNFGMHVHVAVPPGRDRARLLNVVRRYTAHLLSLACSSPFYEGEDTGYASYRMILWKRWPNTGVPPRLESDDEYRRFVDLLVRAGSLGDARNLYWSVRPHPVYPTLEFRVTDVCPRIDDAVAIATLIRLLVASAADGVLEDRHRLGLSESLEHAVLADNEWAAARHGLDALLVDPESGATRVPVRTALRRLVDRLMRTAEALGEGARLARIEALLERGNGADRMRRVARECGGLHPLVHWLAAETLVGTGMDRRRVQRERCA